MKNIKNVMVGLTALLYTACAAPNVSVIPKTEELDFVNYRTTAKNITTELRENSALTLYDLDGDGDYEVLEGRRLLYATDKKIYAAEHPRIYMFDYDNDGEISELETLLDDAEDGINGNEICVAHYNKALKEQNKYEHGY